MSKIEITADAINKALADGKPTSLTGLWKAITGKKISVPGSIASKMRELVPDIMDRLTANKPEETSGAKQKPKQAKQTKKTPVKSKVPRHPKNPFREGAYGLLVDLLAQAGDKGISRDELLKDFCRITNKPIQNAKYDLQVILSASTDSERLHRSCREGFSILRQGTHYTLRWA